MKILICGLAALAIATSCAEQKKENKMGTYGYDIEFFKNNNVDFLELTSADSLSRIVVVPAYQGRVMTSTTEGNSGDSYGWINYKLITEGLTNPQFNPIGGEERFWLGPEGGPYSLYFEKGKQQIYENWQVPAVIDTDNYEIANQSGSSVTFIKDTELINASGTKFNMGIERTISMLDKKEVSTLLGAEIGSLKMIAYQTDNTITNLGDKAWTKDGGLISIWLLGMFNPTPTTTVFIPYNAEGEGIIVNDDYFGKVPSDRLKIEDNTIFLKIDGKHRSKIGVPASRATEICGSYDSQKSVLTLVWCSIPETEEIYVNGKWGKQEDPYAGDVINGYNDGPVEDGSIMGPFYEIESSSYAAELAPKESINHIQKTIHIQGDKAEIDKITNKVFGLNIDSIIAKFKD